MFLRQRWFFEKLLSDQCVWKTFGTDQLLGLLLIDNSDVDVAENFQFAAESLTAPDHLIPKCHSKIFSGNQLCFYHIDPVVRKGYLFARWIENIYQEAILAVYCMNYMDTIIPHILRYSSKFGFFTGKIGCNVFIIQQFSVSTDKHDVFIGSYMSSTYACSCTQTYAKILAGKAINKPSL